MTTAYIIANQYGQYLSKQDLWLMPDEMKKPFITTHRDQALNTLVENNSHNVELRLKIIEVETCDKDKPIYPEHNNSFLPLPAVVKAAEEAEKIAAEENAEVEKARERSTLAEQQAVATAASDTFDNSGSAFAAPSTQSTSIGGVTTEEELSSDEQEQVIARMLAAQNALLNNK